MDILIEKVERITAGLGEILKETSTKMYTPFFIGCNKQYGPYAQFGY